MHLLACGKGITPAGGGSGVAQWRCCARGDAEGRASGAEPIVVGSSACVCAAVWPGAQSALSPPFVWHRACRAAGGVQARARARPARLALPSLLAVLPARQGGVVCVVFHAGAACPPAQRQMRYMERRGARDAAPVRVLRRRGSSLSRPEESWTLNVELASPNVRRCRLFLRPRWRRHSRWQASPCFPAAPSARAQLLQIFCPNLAVFSPSRVPSCSEAWQ